MFSSTENNTNNNVQQPKKITIISGGTASNSLVSIFSSLSPNISYILPISDNGGSTSELIRVVGGPAIGDLRSRITRLIPEKSESLRTLLSYRLSENASLAKAEWNEIVEGTHPLWFEVQSQCKELIRPFFIHVHVELLKRSRPGREFRFEKANVGNLFLTGARLFCGALDPAIELFLRVTLVPSTIAVLPSLNTNFSHHISAQLDNGTIITGQSQISHPSENHLTPVKDVPHANIPKPFSTTDTTHSISHQLQNLLVDDSVSPEPFDCIPPKPYENTSNTDIDGSTTLFQFDRKESYGSSPGSIVSIPPALSIPISSSSFGHDNTNVIKSATDNNNLHSKFGVRGSINRSSLPSTTSPPSPDHDQEDAHLPFSHPDLKISQLHFHKDTNIPLISPIRRVFYINPYGQEIHPRASSRVIRTLEEADVVIYSIGSLFTSTIPVVILQGFASSIQENSHLKKKKLLLLNGSKDRETESLDALGFVRALVGACLYSELGGKSSIYYNNSFSSSNISLSLLAKQQQKQQQSLLNRSRQRDFAASNYTTTSSHAQDILMRPTPRLSKTYNPMMDNSNVGGYLSPFEHNSQDLGNDYNVTPSDYESQQFGNGLYRNPNNSNYNLLCASDQDIDDVYNKEKINSASWIKYISHIVYLKESPLCPNEEALSELRSKGIKCYELSAIYDKLDTSHTSAIYPPDSLRDLLNKIINE